MMNPFFTIFTPTYNRAKLLPRLYESLVAQNMEGFEWLVVDDGSSDGTKDLIASYITENKIRIRYVYQNNGGKHIAINTGLKNAGGKWFMTIDSDDYLRKNALKNIFEIAQNLQEGFAGFTGIHFSENVVFDEALFGHKTWTQQDSYIWPHHGEMVFILKTEIARQFPFPVFEGEKFCQESLVLRRLLKIHDVLFTDNVFVSGNYMEDGLTANVWKNMLKSPRYSMLNYSERISQASSNEDQKKLFAKNYWDIALSAPHIPWLEKLKGIPMKYTADYFWNKVKKRWNRK